MPTRLLLIAILALLTSSCGGGDKHFPSSNPPEYDPKKVYTIPTAPPIPPVASPAKPAEPELPPIQLPSLEPGPNEKGAWRKIPLKPEALPSLKGAKTTCDALSKLVQGLGSAQLFAGTEGAALKNALGSQAASIARTLDQQLTDTLKTQLGPLVADCPSPAPPRKSSRLKDFSQPARIVLTHASSGGPLLLAQAPAPQEEKDGYTVTKTQQVQEAPPGWVGRKTTDRSSEVGNKPETAGNRKSYVLILGGKALKCPAPDGLVPGDFEYALLLDQTITESGAIRLVHHGRHVGVTLKGQVGDDAKLRYIDVDASIVIEVAGTDLQTSIRRNRYQFRFNPSSFAISNAMATAWESGGAEPKDSDTAASLLAAIMLFSGSLYLQAEAEWVKLNTCVEIIFTPASKQRKLGPKESVKVQAELRTKKEQAVVPAKFLNAVEVPTPNTGKVSPTQAEAKPGAPAIFTYTAPSKRVRGSGFQVDALSRAGTAEGKWEAATDASYILEFQSVIISKNVPARPHGPVQSQVSGIVRLEAQDEGKDSGEASFRGQGQLSYDTKPLPAPLAVPQCTWRQTQGKGVTSFQVANARIVIGDQQGRNDIPKGGSAEIEVLFGIGKTEEITISSTCLPMPPMPNPFFKVMFIMGRMENTGSGDPFVLWRLKDWTYVGQNGVVATKTLRSTCKGMCDQEVSTFTLREDSGSQVTPLQ